MKSILPLYLLFFAGTAVSKRVVRNCDFFNNCPDGYKKFYDGVNALNSFCLCETETSFNDPCEKARNNCLSFSEENCESVIKVCPPEDIVSLCDYDYFRFPQLCDTAAAQLRAKEEGLSRPKSVCDDVKKECSDGQSNQCSDVAKRCGPDGVIELCTSKKITDTATCVDAKRQKMKLEAEKNKYVCRLSKSLCSGIPNDSNTCDEMLSVCDSDTVAKLCYKGVIKSQETCVDAIQKTMFLTLEEINEDECDAQIEKCKLTSLDGCADIPTVCGKEVVAAMCKRDYIIKKIPSYNIMCKGIDTKAAYPGCDAFSSACLANSSTCKLAKRYCGRKSQARLCAAGKFDVDSYTCRTALYQYPEYKNNTGLK